MHGKRFGVLSEQGRWLRRTEASSRPLLPSHVSAPWLVIHFVNDQSVASSQEKGGLVLGQNLFVVFDLEAQLVLGFFLGEEQKEVA